MSRGPRWTPAEEDALRREYLSRPLSELAATLGRTSRAIRVQACRLGVTSGYANGKPPRCACGSCALCKRRAAQRAAREREEAREARRAAREGESP